VLHFDETWAVEPLERTAEREVGEASETFPFGVYAVDNPEARVQAGT
jgi:hypothetical protein